jgi:hypothetical protein
VCKHVVQWNAKVQAPHEKLTVIKQYLAFQAQNTAGVRQGAGAGGGGGQSLPVEDRMQEIRGIFGKKGVDWGPHRRVCQHFSRLHAGKLLVESADDSAKECACTITQEVPETNGN